VALRALALARAWLPALDQTAVAQRVTKVLQRSVEWHPLEERP